MMKPTPSKSFLLLLAGLSAIAVFAFRHSQKEFSPSLSDDSVILSGVAPLEVLPVAYPPNLDFGKGKLALFDFTVPLTEDFRIEELSVVLDGAASGEVEELWLRFNSVRVYAKADVAGKRVTFDVFPPVFPPGTSPPVEFGDLPIHIFQTAQETQALVRPEGRLPQTLARGSMLSIGVYGKWSSDIRSREPREGFRLCLDEISGVLEPSGRKAHTSLPQPLCWERMGISAERVPAMEELSYDVPGRPFAELRSGNGVTRVPVEVVDTFEGRAKGLANRDALPKERGMLFVWGGNEFSTFTMAGMRFGLDIIFMEGIGENTGRVVDIFPELSLCPPRMSCALVTSRRSAQYVLEVNAGFAREHNITTGDIVTIHF